MHPYYLGNVVDGILSFLDEKFFSDWLSETTLLTLVFFIFKDIFWGFYALNDSVQWRVDRKIFGWERGAGLAKNHWEQESNPGRPERTGAMYRHNNHKPTDTDIVIVSKSITHLHNFSSLLPSSFFALNRPWPGFTEKA